jgi:multicomponent Na+:H+ antiporter subunit C
VPFVGADSAAVLDTTADPLPQAMVLTAIVITFGVSAFLLALAYRSWVLTQQDEVQDDVEDRRVFSLRRQEAVLRAQDAGRRVDDEDAD